jgi:hypothetical protein
MSPVSSGLPSTMRKPRRARVPVASDRLARGLAALHLLPCLSSSLANWLSR